MADARLLLAYARLLKGLQPLAFMSFTIKPNVFGGMAARMCRIPSLANVTGLGTSFLAKGLLWRLAVSLYRLAFRRSHAVFFHNREDLEAFVAARIVAATQARLIPGSGVDLERFRPTLGGGAPEAPPVFLFVGRLIRDKGVREFVEAARLLRPKFPGARFQLLGDIDPGNRTSIRESELGSWLDEGIVEHLPERSDVRPHMRSATAVVLPSYREGLSRALLEAAALGKPLVGTEVPGVRELVHEDVTGALCKPRDPESLALAIERIARMPRPRLSEIGANARSKVEREYGEELVVKAYLDVLAEIAENQRG